MDPFGVDEYASFANVRWNEVPVASYGGCYDICPPNGFSSFNPPHMWNYYLPGFISFSLVYDERSVDALESFMFFFNRCDRKRRCHMPLAIHGGRAGLSAGDIPTSSVRL